MDDYSVLNSEWCAKYLREGKVSYFGRLNPDDIDGFWYMYFELEEAEMNERLPQRMGEFGLTGGKEEWGAIWAAFYYRHFAGLGEQAAQEKFLITMASARNRQTMEKMQAAAAGDPSLTAPFEGVTIEDWARSAVAMSQASDLAAAERALAQLGMDRAKYDRVNNEFQARMQRDTSFVIAQIYGQAFSGALGMSGGYGLGHADGSMQQLGEEPVTLDRYSEIIGAQGAWSQQGHDVNAMLQQVFGITVIEFSKYGAYWSTKMAADPNIALKHGDLIEKYQAKYGGGRSGGMDDDLTF